MEQIERTEKQRAASRANGTHSRGPLTPAGKAASARNALRHGLCARTLSLANENPEMLTTLLNDLTAEFQPHTPAERLLIVEIAQAKRKWIGRAVRYYSRNSRRRSRFARILKKWHQYRIWLSETSHLNQKMAETAAAVADTFETFDESVRTAIAIDASLECNRAIELHNRIDGRCNRQFHRALNALLKLRKTSKHERTNLSGEEKENS